MRIESNNFAYLSTELVSQNQNELVSQNQNEMTRKPLGIQRASGHECPQTGVWRMMNSASHPVLNIQKGTIMPYYQGAPVNWQLADYILSGMIDD